MTQRKYNLAMAVVMGKDMDSVICDTEATAKECIHWLRQNQVAPMTFFPLDTVRAKVCFEHCEIIPLLIPMPILMLLSVVCVRSDTMTAWRQLSCRSCMRVLAASRNRLVHQ